MDEQTVEAYSAGASRFAAEWRDQPPPTDMYALLHRYFTLGGTTVDIGCGAGRDEFLLDAETANPRRAIEAVTETRC